MIYPIYAYGQPVLRQKAKEVSPDYPKLEKLLADMWETLYHTDGVGLAAPQIGLGLRIFLVDTEQLDDDNEAKLGPGIKKAFINPEIIEESGVDWTYEEGCLSIPDISGEVIRPEKVLIKYYDQNFKEYTEEYIGIDGRVIQHEYDHLDGILFTEYLKPVKKQLIRRKLESIRKGKVDTDYDMKFFKK